MKNIFVHIIKLSIFLPSLSLSVHILSVIWYVVYIDILHMLYIIHSLASLSASLFLHPWFVHSQNFSCHEQWTETLSSSLHKRMYQVYQVNGVHVRDILWFPFQLQLLSFSFSVLLIPGLVHVTKTFPCPWLLFSTFWYLHSSGSKNSIHPLLQHLSHCSASLSQLSVSITCSLESFQFPIPFPSLQGNKRIDVQIRATASFLSVFRNQQSSATDAINFISFYSTSVVSFKQKEAAL